MIKTKKIINTTEWKLRDLKTKYINKYHMAFERYRSQLEILKKNNVLGKDILAIYPMNGADLMPSEYSPVISIDRCLPDISHELIAKRINPELMSYIKDPISPLRESLNIKSDIMYDRQKIIGITKNAAIGKKSRTLFLKSWSGFFDSWDPAREKNSHNLYDEKLLDMARFFIRELLSPGDHIVLIDNINNVQSLSKQLICGAGCTAHRFPQSQKVKVDRMNATVNIESLTIEMLNTGVDRRLFRILVLGGYMQVLRKI